VLVYLLDYNESSRINARVQNNWCKVAGHFPPMFGQYLRV